MKCGCTTMDKPPTWHSSDDRGTLCSLRTSMAAGGSISTGIADSRIEVPQTSECASAPTSHISEYPVYLPPQEEGGVFPLICKSICPSHDSSCVSNIYILAEKLQHYRRTPRLPRPRSCLLWILLRPLEAYFGCNIGYD